MTDRAAGLSSGGVWWGTVVNRKDDPNQSGRIQVRIHGQQDNSTGIPNERLYWAIAMQPITSAGHNQVGSTPVGPIEGSLVQGYWADADRTIPIMTGTIARAGTPQQNNNTTVNGTPQLDLNNNDLPHNARDRRAQGQDRVPAINNNIVTHGIQGAQSPDVRSTGTIPFQAGQNIAALIRQIDPNNLMGSIPTAINGLIGIQGITNIIGQLASGNLSSIAGLLQNAAANQLAAVVAGSGGTLGQIQQAVSSIASVTNLSTLLGGQLGPALQAGVSAVSNAIGNTTAINTQLEQAGRAIAAVQTYNTQFNIMFGRGSASISVPASSISTGSGDTSNGTSNTGNTVVIVPDGTYAPFEHTHVIADVFGLQDALDLKANASTISSILLDITDLETAVAGKANLTHTHAIADITGLQDALDLKLEAADLSGYASSGDLAAKANIASPTFTGTVTLPTVTANGVIQFANTGTALRFANSLNGYTDGTSGSQVFKFPTDNHMYFDNFDGKTIYRRTGYANNLVVEANGEYNFAITPIVGGSANTIWHAGNNPIMPATQCYLTYISSSVLRLIRWDGKYIFINGVNYEIPSAGVDLAPTGLSTATLYYVYVYMNSGTMTLEASTTVPVNDPTYGIKRKDGDASRTLVGICRVDTGPVFVYTGARKWHASYYNRIPRAVEANLTASQATTSLTYTFFAGEMTMSWLSWDDTTCDIVAMCNFTHTSATGRNYVGFYYNGAIIQPASLAQCAAASDPFDQPLSVTAQTQITGLNTCELRGATASGTTTWIGTTSFGTQGTYMRAKAWG